MNRSFWWTLISFIPAALVAVWLLFFMGWNVYQVDEPITASPSDCHAITHFAVIGDFGDTGPALADVAALIDSWAVDFIITVGDNNYPDGEAETIDQNIGHYFQAYIHPYQGRYGPGATENRFFPSPGNHDWETGILQPYLDYFTLPGNERYYQFERGPVQFFMLDSAHQEPDGRSRNSIQAGWLKEQLAAASAPWRIVAMHHPPYASSLRRGSDREMRWPFASWGANLVLSGHEHLYERLHRDGILYIVNGLGGRPSIYPFSMPIWGSRARYNRDHGATRVTADETCINFSTYARDGQLIDSVTLMESVR